jgi:hypothetical protein
VFDGFSNPFCVGIVPSIVTFLDFSHQALTPLPLPLSGYLKSTAAQISIGVPEWICASGYSGEVALFYRKPLRDAVGLGKYLACKIERHEE